MFYENLLFSMVAKKGAGIFFFWTEILGNLFIYAKSLVVLACVQRPSAY
jgi:hypothetical protein